MMSSESRFRLVHGRLIVLSWSILIGLPASAEDVLRFGPPASTPADDGDDMAIWPNRVSRSNSDRWLMQNHDHIRGMRPRLLAINFSNEHSPEFLLTLLKRITVALAESSRYRGYANPAAPAFLNYQMFKFVDLRDVDRRVGDSRRVPVKNRNAKSGFNMKYADYFGDEFAKWIGVIDPKDSRRFLRLQELVDGGYLHEVWLMGSGAPEKEVHIGAYEVVELKPTYDDQFRRIGNQYVQAGNGGDVDQPWTGRSVRIGFVNASRGVGCFLESLSHGMEHNATSNSIPYFSRYFKEYAGLDLRTRFGLPFDDFYALPYGNRAISYPSATSMLIRHNGKEYRVDPYTCVGGNAHFPPNARGHYDLDNNRPVMSTIEDWRGGPNARAKPFTNRAFANYRDLAGDCMGPWLVYWRQNMPGLDNRQLDDRGQPMKNWWPFLFY